MRGTEPAGFEYIVFRPSSRTYWAINKWTRYAEDAMGYSDEAIAKRRAVVIGRKLGERLKVVRVQQIRR